MLEPLGDTKSVSEQAVGTGAVILADQMLDEVALGKSPRLVRAARSLELRADPIADADCGPAGRVKPLLHCNTYGVTRCVTM